MSAEKQILPFEYLKGEAFTDKLKEVLGCSSHYDLSAILNIPKSTFSTWNMHNRTSHEVMVRLHLALGVPIKELALSPSDQALISNEVMDMKADYKPQTSFSDPQLSTLPLKSYCLTNGKLLDTGSVPYSVRRINSFNLERADLIEVETNQAVYLIDKNSTDPVSGEYLISINGRYSINHVLRLPDSLSVTFDGCITKELKETDIAVLGKVVLETKLK
ncbi:TPA: chromosome partitioning protein ParA [Vibrio cholerae]|uniref:helix-turn-helix transcriptional regulator n=2 Tax=Vibrio cholerae TaxID=666 RepID=UPI0000F34C87|nr:helix-turn-helix transcriptional regulator [Vibrio cholerae]EAZ75240.1 bacteriophage CI repressor protein, putative [Vibrio cholerae NCTC 8457]APF80452.1 chromosome partitioning protein ParA [Vibrio cholerae]EGQ8187387.1 chromosome partitioning protein ParA [Vibrio cholerae]EGR0354704.1 chromosome partitioning protein ParA [Vibrio cholerae]EGR0490230.1 chromosome partitioning protein ParA [Vibrio cholerae]